MKESRQPIPTVSRADVERIVKRDYPAVYTQKVYAILDEYANENPNKPCRVQLAALKLADGDIEKLRINIESARRDFRDVIAYAEYPLYFDTIDPSKQYSTQEKKRIIDHDWKQYLEWLKR